MSNFINKLFYSLIALIGIFFLIFMGFYAGYTVKENEQYIYTTFNKYVEYINKYTYDIDPSKNEYLPYEEYYKNELKVRIGRIILLLSIISISLIEIGYKGIHKYKSGLSLYEKFKKFKELVRMKE